MSKFKTKSNKNVLDLTILRYIMQITDQTSTKIQLAITAPALLQNRELHLLLMEEEMELVKNVFSFDKHTSLLHTNTMHIAHQSNPLDLDISQNLNQSLTIELGSYINPETNIFNNAVFKMLKVLYRYPSIYKKVELHQMNISAQSALFKHHLNYLLDYVLSIMHMSPQEENFRNMHYKKVWSGHKSALKEIKELTTNLEALRENKEKEVQSVIAQYKTDIMVIDNLYRKFQGDMQNVSNKYERMQLTLHKSWEIKREELHLKLNKWKQNFEILQKKNLNMTLDLDKIRVKTEAQLFSLINKFDMDMNDRQAEFDELSDTYESDRIKKDSLKAAIQLQDSIYNLLLKERQNVSETYYDEFV